MLLKSLCHYILYLRFALLNLIIISLLLSDKIIRHRPKKKNVITFFKKRDIRTLISTKLFCFFLTHYLPHSKILECLANSGYLIFY